MMINYWMPIGCKHGSIDRSAQSRVRALPVPTTMPFLCRLAPALRRFPPAGRASMSSLRRQPEPQQPPHHPLSSSEATPLVLPEGTPLSDDAASPQVAARPPPAPKTERPRPRIRSTRAALTIVSSLSPLCSDENHAMPKSPFR